MPSFIEREQIVDLIPYQTPTDQIARTYQTKLSYWQQGAAQVKSAYQNAFNLALTREDNINRLHEFMDSAKEQLQKASMSDLSIGSNISQALNIFSPLNKDEEITYDNENTKHYRAERARIESLKKNDPDKYNHKNEQYVNNWFQDFASGKGSSKDNYATRKSYEDYHDVSKELQTMMKEIDPLTIVNDTLTAGYNVRTKTVQHLPAALKARLEAGLSDKAKRQLEINGAVDFHNDRESLRTAYQVAVNNDIKNDNEELRKKSIEFVTANDKMKPALNEQIEALKSKISGNIDLRDNKLAKDDWFNKHYETIAGNVSKEQAIGNYAIAWGQTIEKSQTWNMDPVAAYRAKFAFEAQESAIDRNLEMQKAFLQSQTSLEVAKIGAASRKGAKGEATTNSAGDALTGTIGINADETNTNPETDLAAETYNSSLSTVQASADQLINDFPELKDLVRGTPKDQQAEVIGTALNAHGKLQTQLVQQVAEEVVRDYNNSPEGKANPVPMTMAGYQKVPNRQSRFDQRWQAKTSSDSKFKAIEGFRQTFNDHMQLVGVRKRAVDEVSASVDARLKDETDVRVDRALWNGEDKMDGRAYLNLINTFDGLDLRNNGTTLSLTPSQKKELATESKRLVTSNPNLSPSEAIEAAYSNLYGKDTKVNPEFKKMLTDANSLASQAVNGFGWRDGFGVLSPIVSPITGGREVLSLSEEQYKQYLKGTPYEGKVTKKGTGVNTSYVIYQEDADAILSGMKKTGVDLTFYKGNKRLNIDDSNQGLYSRYKDGLNATYPQENFRMPITARNVDKESDNYQLYLASAKKIAGEDTPIVGISVSPDGSMYYRTVDGDRRESHVKFMDPNPDRMYDPYEGLSSVTKGIVSKFDAQGIAGVRNYQEYSLSSNPLHTIRIMYSGDPTNPRYSIKRAGRLLANGQPDPSDWKDMAEFDGIINSAAELDAVLTGLKQNQQLFAP